LPTVLFELNAGVHRQSQTGGYLHGFEQSARDDAAGTASAQDFADSLKYHPFETIGDFLKSIDQREIYGKELDFFAIAPNFKMYMLGVFAFRHD
jgi:hypothetical protein